MMLHRRSPDNAAASRRRGHDTAQENRRPIVHSRRLQHCCTVDLRPVGTRVRGAGAGKHSAARVRAPDRSRLELQALVRVRPAHRLQMQPAQGRVLALHSSPPAPPEP